MLKEGDFVMGSTSEGFVHGVIEHIMTEGGTLGTPGSEYALVSMPPENPAMSVRRQLLKPRKLALTISQSAKFA